MATEPVRILLVDDDEDDCVTIRGLLDGIERGRFRLSWEPTYERGLAAVARREHDLYLLDFHLGEHDGLELLHQAASQGYRSLILLSGTGDGRADQEAIGAGATDFLPKDRLDTAVLERSLRDAIERNRAEKLLRQSEQRYRELLSAMTTYTYSVDIDNGVAVSTKHGLGCLAATGYSPEEYACNPMLWMSMVHPDDQEMVRSHIAKLLAAQLVPCLPNYCACPGSGPENAYPSLQHRIIRKDGTTRWLRDKIVPYYDAACRLVCYDGLVEDITEQKNAEIAVAEHARHAALRADIGLALNEAEELRPTLQQCTDAIVRHLDAAFARIWTWNEKENVLELQASSGMYTHLDGARARVAVGQGKLGCIARDRQPYLTNDVIADGAIDNLEWARAEAMVAFAGYPMVACGKLLGVVVLFAQKALTQSAFDSLGLLANDIAVGTERILVEQQRKQTQFSVDNATEGILWNSPDGQIVYVNQAGRRLLGYSPGELVSAAIYDFDIELTREMWPSAWADVAQRGSTTFETRLRTKDGRIIPVEVIANCITFQGTPYGFAFIRDIAERKHIEKMLEKKAQQLRQAQKMEAVGTLAGGIAHEFNNLLQAIQGYTKYALDGLPQISQARQDLTTVLKAADRAQSLTRQILGFARCQLLHRQHIQLNEAVTDTIKMLHPVIGEHIRVKVALDDDAGVVHADSAELQQVLLNLCINARDAMPSGGELLLKTESVVLAQDVCDAYPDMTPGPHSVLSVTDTGCGIPPEIIGHIFEPFFTTKKVGKGTGLGLATVYGIVQQHGGAIRVYSEPGRGTTFRMYLPRTDAVAGSQTATSSDSEPGGTETILLAEDESLVRDLARRILEGAGYSVLVAADGEQALRLFEENRDSISLALLDVVMPELSGHDVYRRIQAENPEVKGIFCTGYDPEAAQGRFAAAENLRLIQKPFHPEDLLRCVREVLDESPTC